MADNDDLERLRRGSHDLAQGDFRDADLAELDISERDLTGAYLQKANAERANLSGSVLTGARLHYFKAPGANLSSVELKSTALTQVDFRGSDLRRGVFARSHFSKADLTGADLRGADFRGAHFNEGTLFDDCAADEDTLFDGATIFRPLAKQPAFRFYHVQRGKLVRNSDVPEEERSAPEPPERTVASTRTSDGSAALIASVEQRISERPRDLAAMALALSTSVTEQIEEIEGSKPNDAAALDAHQRYVEFLRQLAAGLHGIGQAIAAIETSNDAAARKQELSRAARMVQHVSDAVEGWLEQNAKVVVDFGFRTGLLCAGTVLLSSCGVPAMAGVFPLTALLSGHSLLDGIKLWSSKKHG